MDLITAIISNACKSAFLRNGFIFFLAKERHHVALSALGIGQRRAQKLLKQFRIIDPLIHVKAEDFKPSVPDIPVIDGALRFSVFFLDEDDPVIQIVIDPLAVPVHIVIGLTVKDLKALVVLFLDPHDGFVFREVLQTIKKRRIVIIVLNAFKSPSGKKPNGSMILRWEAQKQVISREAFSCKRQKLGKRLFRLLVDQKKAGT
ncbi:MAG: hypothetical protein IKS29_09170, partial [Oscillospiraceae bacterium]|nr:hypothetical protein [Oscillospiraceae bacterium]